MSEHLRTGPVQPSAATNAPELALLRLLERHPEYSQRQMSNALGVSLGKAHYLLKALLEKGWVKAQNFKRSEHKTGYLYVLTPHGVHQRLRLTQAFLARKEREYDILQAQIALLRAELAEQPLVGALRQASPVPGPMHRPDTDPTHSKLQRGETRDRRA